MKMALAVFVEQLVIPLKSIYLGIKDGTGLNLNKLNLFFSSRQTR